MHLYEVSMSDGLIRLWYMQTYKLRVIHDTQSILFVSSILLPSHLLIYCNEAISQYLGRLYT